MQKYFCIPQLRFNEYITSMAKFFLLQVILKPRVTLSFYTSITCTASHNRAISNRERRKNIINSLEIYTYLYIIRIKIYICTHSVFILFILKTSNN